MRNKAKAKRFPTSHLGCVKLRQQWRTTTTPTVAAPRRTIRGDVYDRLFSALRLEPLLLLPLFSPFPSLSISPLPSPPPSHHHNTTILPAVNEDASRHWKVVVVVSNSRVYSGVSEVSRFYQPTYHFLLYFFYYDSGYWLGFTADGRGVSCLSHDMTSKCHLTSRHLTSLDVLRAITLYQTLLD